MIRKISFLVVTLLMVVSLIACSTTQQADTPSATTAATSEPAGSETTKPADATASTDEPSGTFTVWSPAEGFNSFEGKSWTAFMSLYPNVKVELVTLGDADTFAKIKTTVAAGSSKDLPTLSLIYDPNNIEAMNWDIWEDLSKAPYNFDVNTQLDFAKELFTNEKGQIVCMSSGNCIQAMQYNRNIAKEYFGTDDPAELRKQFNTIEDYMAAGKALAQKSGGKHYLFSCLDHVVRLGLASNNEPFVLNGKLNIDKSFGNAFELAAQAVADNSVSKQQIWSASWSAELQTDTNMFYVCPTWWIGDIKNNDPDAKDKNKYGLMSMPENCLSTWGGTFYFINAAADPSAKLAAYSWANWVCATPAGSVNWVQNNSQLTLCKELYDIDSVFSAGDKWFGNQPVAQVFREVSMSSVPLRKGTIYDNHIMNVVAGQAENKILQGMSAADALAYMKETIYQQYPELK